MTLSRYCLAVLLLSNLLFAAPNLRAQCGAALTEITDPSDPIPAREPAPKGRKFRLEASGAVSGTYELYLFLRLPGNPSALRYGIWSSPAPNILDMELVCVPNGAYEVAAVARCDGSIATEAGAIAPIQVNNGGQPAITATAVRQFAGVYEIIPTLTVPNGASMSDVQLAHYRRLPDGSYAPPYGGSVAGTNPILLQNANPGDRVTLTLSTCLYSPVSTEVVLSVPEPPLAINGAPIEGDGQRTVIGNAAEKALTVKFTANRPNFDYTTLNAVFEVTSAPSGASGQGLAATDLEAPTASRVARVGVDGTARVFFTAGDTAGTYAIRVSTPSAPGSTVNFISTAVKPDSVAIVKDSTDLADAAASYAVSATAPTTFYAVGLDASRQRIGPMKCNWSTSASGNPSTRGAGTIAPATATRSTTFQPTAVGKMALAANPPMSGVHSAAADLFVTRLYVSVSSFDPANPIDELDRYVPGSRPDGSSVPLPQMPQRVTLHVLTGASSRGTVTFALEDVSNYPGVAMNWPLGNAATTDDLALLDASATQRRSVSVPFSGNGDTSVTLLVMDYAAAGRLRITVQSGRTSYSAGVQRLPLDANGNGIADAGWYSLANSSTGGLNYAPDTNASGDQEDDPQVSGLPGLGKIGDGLSALEEYRGFVVRGTHRRLNPLRKDLFLMIDPTDDWLDDRIVELPMTVHKIRPGEAVGLIGPVINPNRGQAPGSVVAGATLQRGIRARNRLAAPDYRRLDGSIVRADFELSGYTFPLGANLDLIDEAESFLQDVGSPNETAVSDVFDESFWRHFIAYGPNHVRETNVAATDVDDPSHEVIWGGNDWLQSHTNSANSSGDDFNTQTMALICGSSNPPWRTLTVIEVIDSYKNTLLHEIAHGIDVEHDMTACTPSLMGIEDALPARRMLTANDRSQIRLHHKH